VVIEVNCIISLKVFGESAGVNSLQNHSSLVVPQPQKFHEAVDVQKKFRGWIKSLYSHFPRLTRSAGNKFGLQRSHHHHHHHHHWHDSPL
jgi:hypothetical protein